MTIELFRNMGYEVLSANNGKDALAILETMPHVDILFSDVVMPGISGIDLAREARSLIPKIKVILASGYHAGSLTISGAEDYKFVKKPYRMAEIAKILRMPA